VRHYFGDGFVWQYKNGALSPFGTLGDIVRGLGDLPWPKMYEAWDRSLGCWVVYS